MISHRPLAFSLLLPLAACAAGADADYPSLAPRAIEQRPEAVEEAPPAPPPAADATLSADLQRLLGEARAGDTAFTQALPTAERAVSAAGRAAPASEVWVSAQQQLAVLEAARAATAAALEEIDSRFIASATGTASGIAEIEAARAEVEAMTTRQTEKLAALQGRLTPP